MAKVAVVTGVVESLFDFSKKKERSGRDLLLLSATFRSLSAE